MNLHAKWNWTSKLFMDMARTFPQFFFLFYSDHRSRIIKLSELSHTLIFSLYLHGILMNILFFNPLNCSKLVWDDQSRLKYFFIHDKTSIKLFTKNNFKNIFYLKKSTTQSFCFFTSNRHRSQWNIQSIILISRTRRWWLFMCRVVQ